MYFSEPTPIDLDKASLRSSKSILFIWVVPTTELSIVTEYLPEAPPC